jgi:hypothetical protein
MNVPVLWRFVAQFTAAQPAATTCGNPKEVVRKKRRHPENDGRLGAWLVNSRLPRALFEKERAPIGTRSASVIR